MDNRTVTPDPTPGQNSSRSTGDARKSFEPTFHAAESHALARSPIAFDSVGDSGTALEVTTGSSVASSSPRSGPGTTPLRVGGAAAASQHGAPRTDGAAAPTVRPGQLLEPLNERSARALLDKALLHLRRLPERLPCLGSPELKLIGRCVSFCFTKVVDDAPVSRCFNGIVGLIGHQSVLLLHVHMFAADAFARYRRHHRELERRVRQAEQERARKRQRDPRVHFVPYGRDGGVGVNGEDQLSIPEDPTMATELGIFTGGLCVGPNSATAPLITGTERAKHRLMAPHFGTATVGPFPFLALQRRTIHDVRFHLDPSSAWQPLFQDRARVVNDMQRLRVLVRRYLVYTSVDDNAVHLSLIRFLESRGGFSFCEVCAAGPSFFDPIPPLSEAALQRIAMEELHLLLRLHGDLAVARYRRAVPQAPQLAGQEALHREPTVEMMEGMFRRTGVLYATCIPQSTFYSGLVGCGMTVVCAGYLGIAYGLVASDALTHRYAMWLVPFNVTAVVVWAVCFAAITHGATRMCYPLWDRPARMLVRVVASCVAAGMSIVCIVACAASLRDGNLRDIMVHRVSHDQLCAYYASKECSGFSRACSNGVIASDPLCSCGGAAETYASACKSEFLSTAVVLSVPILVIAAVELVVVVYGVYLLFTV